MGALASCNLPGADQDVGNSEEFLPWEMGPHEVAFCLLVRPRLQISSSLIVSIVALFDIATQLGSIRRGPLGPPWALGAASPPDTAGPLEDTRTHRGRRSEISEISINNHQYWVCVPSWSRVVRYLRGEKLVVPVPPPWPDPVTQPGVPSSGLGTLPCLRILDTGYSSIIDFHSG